MAAFNKFNQFVGDVANGFHTLQTHTLKIALSNTAPTTANRILADITQIAAANGYVSGGNTVTVTGATVSGSTFKLVGNDVTFTASGGSFGPLQYAVIYNDTQATPAKPLIGWWDFGSPVTITTGNSFLVDLDQVNGILTLA